MMPAAHTPPGEGDPDFDGRSADPGARLAELLKRAWIAAGRPPMGAVGDEVGYSKASISKVLSGKMPPAWRLVLKLGAALGVPDEVVKDEWHPLWVAAAEQRWRRQAEPGPGRQQCEQCGSFVADNHVHQLWHGRVERSNKPDAHLWASLRDSLPRRKE